MLVSPPADTVASSPTHLQGQELHTHMLTSFSEFSISAPPPAFRHLSPQEPHLLLRRQSENPLTSTTPLDLKPRNKTSDTLRLPCLWAEFTFAISGYKK